MSSDNGVAAFSNINDVALLAFVLIKKIGQIVAAQLQHDRMFNFTSNIILKK